MDVDFYLLPKPPVLNHQVLCLNLPLSYVLFFPMSFDAFLSS